jgi:hypothetical protein
MELLRRDGAPARGLEAEVMVEEDDDLTFVVGDLGQKPPFQRVWYSWQCSTNRPYSVTLAPLTIRPVLLVLAVQPTPFP